MILSGFGVSILIGLTGVGGGALMTPLLIFGFGYPPAVAVATDLVYAAVAKSGAALTHHRQDTVVWGIVGWMALGSLPAAALTLYMAQRLAVYSAQFETMITELLGLMLILTSSVLLLRPYLQRWRQRSTMKTLGTGSIRVITVIVGSLLGVLVTLTSVGAGALAAAALFMLYPRLRPAQVVGTDIAHAVPLAAVAGAGHWQMGTVDGLLLLSLLIGSLPGIYLGSRLCAVVPSHWLRPVLAVILMVVGIRLIA